MKKPSMVTSKEYRGIVSRDRNALYNVLDAIEKAEQSLIETKVVISDVESDHIITNNLSYLGEVKQQIKYMTEYYQTLESYCSMLEVYAPPDVMTAIPRYDSIINGAKADDTEEEDFDSDETLQICRFCGAASPLTAKICKKCGREFDIWKHIKSVPVKTYPDIHRESAKPDDNRMNPDVPVNVVYAAPDVMVTKRKKSSLAERLKKR